MPRLPRRVVPGLPLHITQRGVDRCPTFLSDDDFAFYRWALNEAQAEAQCAVHAYVLMTNHVHLLATPSDIGGPAKMMRSLGRRYVRYFNDRYRRTGTLWEGRYRSALVDSASYLISCSRYIELNPVRAGLTSEPIAYEWSSFRHNSGGEQDPLITEHPLYTALGATRAVRSAAYRAMFSSPLSSPAIATVRAAQRGRPNIYTTPYREAADALLGQRALMDGIRSVAVSTAHG